MDVFVTGATGYIGGAVAVRLLGAGHRVSGLARSPEKAAEQLVWLATGTPGVDWASGQYYAKRKIAKANRLAYDPVLAGELWDRSMAKVDA